MKVLRRTAVPSVLALAAFMAPTAVAQVIESNDGLWGATLDAGANAQITDLFSPAAGGDNLFETLWYEASTFTGGLTQRVENIYEPVSQNIGADSASFLLQRIDGFMDLDASVTMIDGAGGGARFRLTWTNTGSTLEEVKAFAYADLDVAASAGGDDAAWDMGAQSIIQSDGAQTIYFGGLGPYKSWEITTFAQLRNDLDAGRDQLFNAGGGTASDFTGALSGDTALLGPGESMSFSFQIGGLVPAPGALALMGLAGLTGVRRRRRG